MKYVKGLGLILLLTVSRIGICLLVDFTRGRTTRPAIETVHSYPPGTLERLLKQRYIEIDSPMPDRSQWGMHPPPPIVTESTTTGRSR